MNRCIKHILLASVGCLCLAVAAHGADESDVLFFAPFEDSVSARLSTGAGGPKTTGAPRFGPGVRGKAVMLDAQSLLTYAFRGNVVPDEGTVMMWFKPEWRADDDKFHNLFRASTGNFGGKALNSLILYKYPRWARLALYSGNGQKQNPREGRSQAFRNNLEWKPGEWIHVAGTWSATLASTAMYLYLNGERIAACGGAVFLPEREPATFDVGGPEGSGTTWFDDVLVFSRPLQAREVKGIYDAYRGKGKTDARDLPFVSSRELQLRPHVLFAPEKLVVVVDYRGARRELGEKAGSVTLDVLSKRGKKRARNPAPRTGIARCTFDCEAVGAGSVTLSATLRDHAGKVLRTGKLSYDVPEKPEWVGNSLGKTDEVPPPWTPLRTEGDAVRMWGRQYVLEDSALPSQVVTQGRPVMREPVALSATCGGRSSTLAVRPTGAYAGNGAALSRKWRGALGPLKCTASTRVEFDGFMLTDLELTADGPRPVEGLRLVIPFRREAATLYHHCNGEWNDLSDGGGVGAVGWSKPLEFVPYVWLGNEKGGLAWFCESNWNWRNADEKRAIEMVTTTEGVDLVVRFIDETTTLTKPLRLTFGFMATPVKPMPKGWRDWRPMFTSTLNLKRLSASRWGHPDCRNISILWNNHVGTFSYLPADPKQMREKVALLKRNGWQTVVSYYAVNQTQTGTPEYAVMADEWRRNPYAEYTLKKHTSTTVCAASTWADFLLWAIDRTMDETGADGIYLDCSNPKFCRSAEHGCAPGRYTLFATRELYKRMYALVRQKRGDAGFVYAHNSESNFITAYSFADAVINGEQYNRKDLNTLTFEKFRAELSPQPYGVPAFLLPTLVKFQPKGQEKMPGPEFLAFPLLHDVICVPPWLSRDSQKLLVKIRRTMHEFGVADAEFLPYWDNGAELSTSPAGARVSAYLRRDGKAALLIAQGTKTPTTFAVTLLGRLAPLRNLPARNALTQDALSWDGGKLMWTRLDKKVQLVRIGPGRNE